MDPDWSNTYVILDLLQTILDLFQTTRNSKSHQDETFATYEVIMTDHSRLSVISWNHFWPIKIVIADHSLSRNIIKKGVNRLTKTRPFVHKRQAPLPIKGRKEDEKGIDDYLLLTFGCSDQEDLHLMKLIFGTSHEEVVQAKLKHSHGLYCWHL